MIKKIFAAIAVLGAVFPAVAQVPEKEEVDSVSTAFGTVWGGYIHEMLDKQYPADVAAMNEFVNGLADAFTVSPVKEPYYQGVLQGFTLVERLGQMQQLGFPIDRDTLIKSLRATLSGESTGFTTESADGYLNNYMARKYEAMAAADTVSVASQQEFMAREASREGVIKTPDGLLFEVLTEGEGEGPSMNDLVSITYVGRLSDGNVFDEASEPVELPIQGLVAGFSEGLLMMKPGGTYRLIIPSELGYGEKGTAGVIPGNAALDFIITLDRVIKR